MSLYWTDRGGRFALPVFVLAALAAGLLPAEPAYAQTNERPKDRPGVTNQRFDDDCGVAALLMLLQRAGVSVTERQLLDGLDPGSKANALSAADLAGMVSSLGVNLQLDVGFLPLPAVARLAEREPFLVLLKPRVNVASYAIDHFILIEGRAGEGYLVADPDLPSRVRLTDAALGRDAHGRLIEGKPYALVLKLSRDSKRVAERLTPQPGDANLRQWDEAYRLPRALAPGKTVVSIGQLRQETKFTDPTSGVETMESSDVTVFGLSRGIGHRSEVSLSLARISGKGGFRLPDEPFTFERAGSFNATLGISHVPDLVLPQSLGVSTSAAIEWSDDPVPSAGSVNVNIDWAKAGFAAGLSTTLRYDNEFSAVLTPSVSYRLPIQRLFVLDAGLAAPYRIGDDRPNYEAQVALSRSLGSDFRLGAFFNASIFPEKGYRSHQFGVTLGYGIPRRFRLARDATEVR